MTLNFTDDTVYNYEPGSIDNIRRMLPKLYEEQVEDVLRAEDRYLSGGKGYLFTNGTGTGKTYVGLGVAKRFWAQNKRDILIVVPTEQKCIDWISEGSVLNLTISMLKDTNDGGSLFCVTTYANFYQNDALTMRNFHLIIYDESHYLNQNQQGKETSYLSRHKLISKLPSACKELAKGVLSEYPQFNDGDDYETWRWQLDAWNKQLTHHTVSLVGSTKVLFLSATPFAYHKSIKYADGCLFDINETIDEGYKDHPSYNEPIGFDNFLVQNFGYRMRYNKVTIPESGVDVNLLERQFFEKHREMGVMSTRVLKLDVDYSRDFITVESEIGTFINSGMELFHHSDFREKYKYLSEVASKKYNYLYVNQLLEAVKAQEVIPRIQSHLNLGRKVVIFHGYNNSVVSHPFHFDLDKLLTSDTEWMFSLITKEIARFNMEYPEYVNLDLSRLGNTREVISGAFSNMKQYNGTVSKKKRKDYIIDFNHGETYSILVQTRAGREGISLHDTVGDKQRVLINLGLPVAPTEAIQTEGRIYRSGSKSDAIYEYITLQTNFERYAFATKIAERSRTAENLAMGNLARDLHTGFTEGYLNSHYEPPTLDQGKGGKESDRQLLDITDFDRAKTYYFAKGKKTSSNKSREGNDYYATPEPLGYKMAEWLDIKSDKRALEPSAGHGAIARWFPEHCNNTFIEPSYDLQSQLVINSGKARVIQDSFENFNNHNKFEYIAMNPPFGKSGKTAMEHIDKAVTMHMFRYSQEGSKLLAIVPQGNSMQKRLDAFYESVLFDDFIMTGEIILPSCTFSRAGTNVHCKIIRIVHKNTPGATYNLRSMDFSYCKDIGEFFDEIEHYNF
tara:strand:+ start:1771 stop:4305 length:2535 start_codon:yes stop_codon:yes gene_type:complete